MSRQSSVLSREEVAKHVTPDSVWVIVSNVVYDVTSFLPEHPGGRQILLNHGGEDVTDLFLNFHPVSARRNLRALRVGECEKRATGNELERDWNNLRRTLTAEGLFEASASYYSWLFVRTMALAIVAVYLATACASPAMKLLGALVFAFFWQQCGWLAHDFGHHQVFKDRRLNDAALFFIGNVCQGFSLSWWKDKHNIHHANPNVVKSEDRSGDPDIDTMPFLAWCESFVEGEDLDLLPALIVRNQRIFIWPLFFFARVSWLVQSVLFNTAGTSTGDLVHSDGMFSSSSPSSRSSAAAAEKESARDGLRDRGLVHFFTELGTLAVHWIGYALVALQIYRDSGWLVLFLFIAVSQGLSGVMLGAVFAVGHNGTEIVSPEVAPSLSFVEAQVRTTRNVRSNWWLDYVMGHLNFQVEHHLFPAMPRHNLRKAQKHVVEFCAKHGIKYQLTGFRAGTREYLEDLERVSGKLKSPGGKSLWMHFRNAVTRRFFV